MWLPGEVITWRGIFREKLWHVVSMIVVRDDPHELVTLLLPGAESMAEENYARSVKNSNRRWNFQDQDWRLEKWQWHTNRVLMLTEPGKFYSISLFWNQASNEFLGYYVNFQLPFKRSHCGINTLDLDLDIDIEPDLNWRWKDEDDYQLAIEHGIIDPEWIQGIEDAKPEIVQRIERRQSPFNGSWLDWQPDPAWMPPKLPENWDKI